MPRARPTWPPLVAPPRRSWPRATPWPRTWRRWWRGRGSCGTCSSADSSSGALAADGDLGLVAEGGAEDVEEVGLGALILQPLDRLDAQRGLTVLEILFLQGLRQDLELPIAEGAAQPVAARLVQPDHRAPSR